MHLEHSSKLVCGIDSISILVYVRTYVRLCLIIYVYVRTICIYIYVWLGYIQLSAYICTRFVTNASNSVSRPVHSFSSPRISEYLFRQAFLMHGQQSMLYSLRVSIMPAYRHSYLRFARLAIDRILGQLGSVSKLLSRHPSLDLFNDVYLRMETVHDCV